MYTWFMKKKCTCINCQVDSSVYLVQEATVFYNDFEVLFKKE